MANFSLDKKLLFLTEEIQTIQQTLDQKVPTQTGSTVELEVRFQPYCLHSNKYISWSESEIRRIHQECKQKFPTHRMERDQVSIKTHPSKPDTVIRKIQTITEDGRVTGTTYQYKWSSSQVKSDIYLITGLQWEYQKKTRRMELQKSQLPYDRIRVSKAVESPSTENEFHSIGSSSFQRRRTRTIYEITDQDPLRGNADGSPEIEIHITETSSPRKFEIEVEFNPNRYKQARNLLMALKPLLYIFYPQVPTYFSKERLRAEGLDQLPGYIKPSNRPVNIQERHLTSSLFDYAITNKLDGVEYKVWFRPTPSKKNMDLILFNDKQLWLVQRWERKAVSENVWSNVLWMAEGVLTPSGKIQIHLFDKSTSDYSFQQNGLLRQRIEHANEWIKWVQTEYPGEFELYVKSFHYPLARDGMGVVDAIRSCVKEMTDRFGLARVSEENDGIILEPIDSSLELTTLKWKFPSKVSIDFRMKRVGPSRYELQHSGESTYYYINENEQNTFAIYAPATEDDLFGLDPNQLDNLIGEFLYSRGKWILLRIRWDKVKPNALMVARETFPDMMHPRTLVWMLRHIEQIEANDESSFVPISDGYRQYANLVIKNRLINTWCTKQSVLDIGSGLGGDLNRYQKARVNRLIMVEPEKSYLRELEQRSTQLGTTPYLIIPSGGERTSFIVEKLRQSYKDYRVNTIAMMQSLTHFYSSEKKLDQLAETISSTLLPEGTVMGAVMDGSLVQEWLKERNDYIQGNSFRLYPDSTPEDSDQFSTIVTTHLHGTQTATHVKEALVQLPQLSAKLEPLQLTLTECRPFVERCRSLTDTHILDRARIRKETLEGLFDDLTTFYGDSVLQEYLEYLLVEGDHDDPVLIKLTDDPLVKESWSHTSLWQAFPLIETHIDKGIEQIHNISITHVEHTKSPLEMHMEAFKIRCQVLNKCCPRYQFQYKDIGYKPTDNIVEGFSNNTHSYFASFCSIWPDVDPGSLGPFTSRSFYSSSVIYLVPNPSVRLLNKYITHVKMLCQYHTIVLVVPQQDDLIRLIDTYLRDYTWGKQAYTSHLIDTTTNRAIPHVEYRLGLKCKFEGRRAVMRSDDFLSITRDEKRLLSMYTTFVYQSYRILDNLFSLGLSLGYIITGHSSFLSAFLMSYMGGSYYAELESRFENTIRSPFLFDRYLEQLLSKEILQRKPDCLKEETPSLDSSGRSWIDSSKEKELVEGFLLHEWESQLNTLDWLAVATNTAIMVIENQTQTVYRGRRIDTVVFVYKVGSTYHGCRVLPGNVGSVSYDEAIRLPFWSMI